MNKNEKSVKKAEKHTHTYPNRGTKKKIKTELKNSLKSKVDSNRQKNESASLKTHYLKLQKQTFKNKEKRTQPKGLAEYYQVYALEKSKRRKNKRGENLFEEITAQNSQI